MEELTSAGVVEAGDFVLLVVHARSGARAIDGVTDRMRTDVAETDRGGTLSEVDDRGLVVAWQEYLARRELRAGALFAAATAAGAAEARAYRSVGRAVFGVVIDQVFRDLDRGAGAVLAGARETAERAADVLEVAGEAIPYLAIGALVLLGFWSFGKLQ